MVAIKCVECGVGNYRPIKSSYVLPLGKQVMIMPDAPAYICDVCGFRCFDDAFLESIHELLKYTAQGDDARQGKRPAMPPMMLPTWDSARRPR